MKTVEEMKTAENARSIRHPHEPDIAPSIAPDGHCRICRLLCELEEAVKSGNYINGLYEQEKEHREKWANLYVKLKEKQKQIQLDAYKAGLRDAANKIVAGIAGLDSSEARLLLDHQKAILTDANNRTELP